MNQWKIILTDNTGEDYYPADELIAEHISHHGYAEKMAEALNGRTRDFSCTYFKVVPQEEPLKPASVFTP